MIISEYVDVYINSSNKKYFESLGYKCGKNGKKIKVKVCDLKKYSRAIVKVRCDFCGRIYEIQYSSKNHGKYPEIDACKYCISKKIKMIFNIEYGVDNISQLKETQNKIKKNNIEKYGVESTSSLDFVKEKAKRTSIERYGVECSAMSDEAKKKRANTNLKKYGTEFAISSKAIRKKIKHTFNTKYNVDNPSQIDEVMKKIINSKHNNSNQTSSKQQNILHEYICGELNYPFLRYYIDIAFPEEKIAVEYIGGGHNLSVKLGNISEKEFTRNENFRKKQLFDNGWKIIEFISMKNKITDEQTSKKIMIFCRNLFNNYNKHYIKIYIDDDRIVSGNDKICYKNTLNDWNEKTPYTMEV